MPAFRDESGNKTWFCKFNYTNWKGEKLTKKKRGFLTKKEALKWEQEFLNQHSESIEMSFREFFELYKRDRKPRIRENTWRTKEAIVNQKTLSYIGDLKGASFFIYLSLRLFYIFELLQETLLHILAKVKIFMIQ